jgi:hypothetical protein
MYIQLSELASSIEQSLKELQTALEETKNKKPYDV